MYFLSSFHHSCLLSFFLSSLSPSCGTGPLPSSCLSIHFSVNPFFLHSLLHSITAAFSFFPPFLPPSWLDHSHPTVWLSVHTSTIQAIHPCTYLSVQPTSQPYIHNFALSFLFLLYSPSLSFFFFFFSLLTPLSTQLYTGTSKLFSHPDKKKITEDVLQ